MQKIKLFRLEYIEFGVPSPTFFTILLIYKHESSFSTTIIPLRLTTSILTVWSLMGILA